MRIHSFESEFEAIRLPEIAGSPLGHADLDDLVAQIPVSEKLDSSRQVLLFDAVRTYYFAKAFRAEVAALSAPLPDSIAQTVAVMENDLLRLAVINIASINDRLPRTKSLPNMLIALKEAFAVSPNSNSAAAVELIDELLKKINADTQLPLRYVRHMRNKWAGHASFDRTLDQWADAGVSLNLPLVEEALARLVNAHQDLNEIISLSDGDVKMRSERSEQTLERDGTVSVAMGIDWSSTVVFGRLTRSAATSAAKRLVGRLAAD